MVKVQILANGEGLDLPSYATSGAAGMDLRAALLALPGRPAFLMIAPGEVELVPCGFAVAVPFGHELQVRARSSMGWRQIIVPNAPGTIDSDYRGEVAVFLLNLSPLPFKISRGDRIAQAILAPVAHCEWDPVLVLPPTQRGAGGFGSTGVK